MQPLPLRLRYLKEAAAQQPVRRPAAERVLPHPPAARGPFEGDPRIAWGINDGPDRGGGATKDGVFVREMFEYDLDQYDPFKTSIEKMCDHWSDWDGMQEVVGEARAQGLIPLQFEGIAPEAEGIAARTEKYTTERWGRLSKL